MYDKGLRDWALKKDPVRFPYFPRLPEYYAHPEGQDLFGKLGATGIRAALFGTYVGLGDITMVTRNLKGFQPNFFRVLYYAAPMTAMATAWTFTTFVSTNIAGECGYVNYILGSYAAGGIFGAWVKSPQYGWFVGSLFAIFSMVKYHSIENKWSIFPDILSNCVADELFGWDLPEISSVPEGEKEWIAGSYIGDGNLKKIKSE